jgi:hypothetical protein
MGHGFNAVGRMCPPPRSLAAEANGASWSGPDAGPTEYKVAVRCYAPKAGSPPIVSAAHAALPPPGRGQTHTNPLRNEGQSHAKRLQT